MSRPRNILLRRICWLLAVVLVVSILYVAVAPSLDLAPSALRAFRAALAVLICFCLWVSIVAGTVSITILEYGITGRTRFARACVFRISDLLALHCVSLC
jgi:hypothetical protein